ncbi:histidine kinase (plasmid) [Leptolyngbya sp. BL0902]|uniref:sensor histidine kinase n=1 Tax=Leptolyngbya sp. BL0902 TaxID=1115757 RepID=UPI0018E73826|nr:CHASE3 domain-containing protein [Leptolyngbya sp. BL0902]QQE67440.1 histidine kinase [Leptolyngbya sp. BL0902]
MANLAHHLSQPWQALPIRWRGAVIIAIPVTCMFTALSSFAWLKASLAEDEIWIQHTQTVRLETKYLANALVEAETGVRGYGLTQREEFLEPYRWAQLEIPTSLDRLESLVSDNAAQVERVQEIRQLVNDNVRIFEQKLTLNQDLQQLPAEPDTLVPAAELYAWLEEGKDTMDATRDAIDHFMMVEDTLLTQRIQHRDRYQQGAWLVLCLLAVMGTLAAFFAMHLFHQLERELANREDHLKLTNHRLETACHQLQRFTANASHELRAPLAAILSNAQVGLMALEDFEVEHCELDEIQIHDVRPRLENIVSLTKTMGTLVNELLFLARHEGLLAPEALKPVNLTDLVAQIAEDFQSEAQAHNLHFSSQSPDTAVLVNADTNLLRQAITNLLSNACRYTPAGGHIQLRLWQKESQIIIEVKDTGIGISEASLPMIFERFYRVDPKRSKASGGLGLGLAIVQQIVQAHRGHIEVNSRLGEGSTFSILLNPEPQR